MAIILDKARVTVRQRADGTRYYDVRVRSRVKPMLSKQGIIEYAEGAEQKVAILGAALAEELCEQYGDTIDPSEVARRVLELAKWARTQPVQHGGEEPRVMDRALLKR